MKQLDRVWIFWHNSGMTEGKKEMDCYMINTKVYVCMKETEDEGKRIVHVFSNKDKAWAWVRDSFVEFTKNYSHIFRENFEWTNTETEHSCWCNYLAYGWYVYEMKIEN